MYVANLKNYHLKQDDIVIVDKEDEIEEYFGGIKLRIYPTTDNIGYFIRNSDVSRFFFNEDVAMGNELYWLKESVDLLKDNEQYLNQPGTNADAIKDFEKRIEELKLLMSNPTATAKQIEWYDDDFKKSIDSTTKYRAFESYRNAWNMFKKVPKTGIPRFKRKRRYNHSFQINVQTNKNTGEMTVKFPRKGYLTLPKVKNEIRFSGIGRRKELFNRIDGKDIRITTATIKMENDGTWWISFQLRSKNPIYEQYEKTNSMIGVDLNVDNFYMDSDGNVVENPRFFKKQKKAIARKQRIMNRRMRRAKKEHRKLEDSKNYQKIRLLKAKLEKHKITRARHEFLNKVTTELVKKHDVIIAEELRSSNMMRNHRLAQAIQDVGWRTFLTMLEYKCLIHGKLFIAVNPKNTTQMCSLCGFVWPKGQKLTLEDREWTCPDCGHYHIRDVNAARNILSKGAKRLTV